MKRDVKVGLFVAAVVCGLAAILLGGGLSARTPEQAPALSLAGEGLAEAPLAAAEEAAASVPTDLVEGIEPPAEPEEAAAAAATGPVEETLEPLETFEFPDDAFAVEPATEAQGGDAGPSDPLPPQPDDFTAETPDDLREAAPGAGVGPRPFPGEGGGDLEPAIPVGGGETAEAGLEDGDADRDETAPEAGRLLYVVREGESFWTISRKLFGKVGYFDEVVRANPDVDPTRVRPGQVIAIPRIEGAELREDLLAGPEELERRSRRPRVYLARDTKHVIRVGETLGDIAQKYYRSAIKWPHILAANPDLDPKRLRAGKPITVPALTEPPGRPRLPAAAARPRRTTREPRVYLQEDATHVVEAGDTLEGISLKHYGVRHRWNHILADRRNAGLDARSLRPGREIVIPALTE